MTKQMKDILTHSGAAVAMMIILLLLPHQISVTVAVVSSWYMWELGQRIKIDYENRGLRYWWNPLRWGRQAKLEFFCPAIAALIVFVIYLVII
jgi:hypothetical protein